jgi:hypothetical protein
MNRVVSIACSMLVTVVALAMVVVGTTGTALAGPKPTIAILGLEVKDDGGGIDEKSVKVARALSEGLRNQAKKASGPYTIAAGSTDKEQVDMELLIGCDDEGAGGRDCMAKIGSELTADYLLYGGVTKSRSGYQVSLTLLSVSSKTKIRAVNENIPGKETGPTDLERWGKSMYLRVTGGSAGGTLVVESNVEGATVLLDSQPKGRIAKGRAELRDVPEGRYKVSVQAEGYDPEEMVVNVDAGGEVSATLTMRKKSGGGDDGGGVGPGGDGGGDGGGSGGGEIGPGPDLGGGGGGKLIEGTVSEDSRTGWKVMAGVGLAGLIGGEAMAFVYWQKYSDREDQPDCGVGTPCGDEGKKEARMTNIGHGVAAVSGAVFLVGVYKGFLSSGGKRTESSAVIGRQRSTRQVSVSPTLAPGGGGATVRIDF